MEKLSIQPDNAEDFKKIVELSEKLKKAWKKQIKKKEKSEKKDDSEETKVNKKPANKEQELKVPKELRLEIGDR